MHVANLWTGNVIEWNGLLRNDPGTLDARFAEMVERQSRFVFCVVYAVLRNIQDSEDAVQEMFLKLYRTGAWQRMTDERSFLARAAWRIAVDRLPRQREIVMPSARSQFDDPEAMLMNANSTAILHRLIDSLPEELRQPIALSGIEDLSSREIAHILAIPEGTVRRRIMRARQILRDKFDRFR
jgi:RNA polymerase sigma-70 factor (ECF subfamily)